MKRGADVTQPMKYVKHGMIDNYNVFLIIYIQVIDRNVLDISDAAYIHEHSS